MRVPVFVFVCIYVCVYAYAYRRAYIYASSHYVSDWIGSSHQWVRAECFVRWRRRREERGQTQTERRQEQMITSRAEFASGCEDDGACTGNEDELGEMTDAMKQRAEELGREYLVMAEAKLRERGRIC